MAELIAAMTFLTLVTITAAIMTKSAGSEKAVRDRMGRYLEEPIYGADASMGPAWEGPGLSGWRAVVREMSRYFEAGQWTRLMEKKIVQAGLLLRGSEFVVICVGAAIFGSLLLGLLLGTAGLVLGGLVGFGLPVILLWNKAERRCKLFNNQLGDALVLIANSLRTGYSFLQAIELVSKEMPPPISQEFARLLRELSLGMTHEEGLSNLARRLDDDDLDLVVTAVLIQRQLGGNLSEVLENIASTIRSRIKLKGEVRMLTAQGRISGMILSFLPVAIGGAVFMMSPDYIMKLFTHPLGNMMLLVALVNQIIGTLVIRKIVNVRL